jgi:energy-coupling factor transporter ATP-binding protein EcfA2
VATPLPISGATIDADGAPTSGRAGRSIGDAPLANAAHLVLSCVQKSYGEIEAIRDASFALTAGEFLSMLGPSGCGKSTLLMMIAGLISPSAGKITVSGSPICGPRREIGIRIPVARCSSRGGRSSTTCCSQSRQPKTEPPTSVFIAHGHDEGALHMIARFIERLGLQVIILHERVNKGRTIIEKFQEEAASVGFAIVLMTSDDLGGAKSAANPKSRARQNVVFELGFFLGVLGPHRVAAVVKGDLELPSDLQGVAYISLDRGDWRIELGRELQSAGYVVDWNQVMGS